MLRFLSAAWNCYHSLHRLIFLSSVPLPQCAVCAAKQHSTPPIGGFRATRSANYPPPPSPSTPAGCSRSPGNAPPPLEGKRETCTHARAPPQNTHRSCKYAVDHQRDQAATPACKYLCLLNIDEQVQAFGQWVGWSRWWLGGVFFCQAELYWIVVVLVIAHEYVYIFL